MQRDTDFCLSFTHIPGFGHFIQRNLIYMNFKIYRSILMHKGLAAELSKRCRQDQFVETFCMVRKFRNKFRIWFWIHKTYILFCFRNKSWLQGWISNANICFLLLNFKIIIALIFWVLLGSTFCAIFYMTISIFEKPQRKLLKL